MPAQFFTLCGDYVTWYWLPVCYLLVKLWRVMFLVANVILNKSNVITIRYEADVLTLLFFRDGKIVFSSQLANLRLDHSAQRKDHFCQLVLLQVEQEIRLILVRINTLSQ